MSVRRFAGLLVLGVALGVGVWVPLHHTDGRSDQGSPATSLSTTTSSADGSTEPSGAPGRHPRRSADSSHSSTPPAAGPTDGRSGGVGTEMLPQPSSAPSSSAGLPGLEPPRSTTRPLVSTPLPRPATRKGRLAPGYPGVLAPPRGHIIATSSVSPGGGVLQVGLTASCRRPCDPVKMLRLRLAGRGFTEISAQAAENHPTAGFQRGDDSVTVSVTDRSKKRLDYVLFGVLHAKA